MLLSALLRADQVAPRKVAVDDGRTALTFARLTTLARVMRDIVQRQTDNRHVGIMLPASAAFPGCLFGVLWAGKTAVPLNFLLSPDELAAIVRDAGLDVVFTVRHFADLAAQLPVRTIFLEDLSLKRRIFFAGFRRRPPVGEVDPNATAVILYTSGTTGSPKGVQLTFENLHGNCVDTISTLRIDPRQRFLNVLPPFHVFGLTALVLVPIYLHASVYPVPRFSPVAMVKTISRHRVTIMMAIPSMYAAVLKTKSSQPEDFESVTLAISGGEPLSATVASAFHERFGVLLREGYGLTETSPVVAVNTLDAHRPGTVGRPIDNVTVRIVDRSTVADPSRVTGATDGADAPGAALPAGEDGEILVKGPGVMKGYYGHDEATRAVIDSDGWFHTGDCGQLDADGFLSITGRVKEMMIIGGENVFPREIESVLEQHEDVLEVAVVGIPDDLRGEVPAAFVIPRHGAEPTEQTLRNFAKSRLAGFKVPRRIVVRDDLPRGPTGKLLKRQLRRLL